MATTGRPQRRTTPQEQIAAARQMLERAGIAPADAAIDAEVLARHALGWDRAQLTARGREPAPPGFAEEFSALVTRRASREPVAFITGHREFWGLDFEVTRDVLIPRPETELVIETAGEWRQDRDSVHRIVDVGTGSGCLAVALAVEFPAAHVLAIDISALALKVAKRNAAAHVPGRITFARGDLLDPVQGPVDLIVSNPPYVPAAAALSPDILRFEPAVALFSGENGLTLLTRLIRSARTRLAADGAFVVEFGFGQDEQILALAHEAGWREMAIKEDLQRIPRVAILRP
jgi:release factor glutamine methyltransferase